MTDQAKLFNKYNVGLFADKFFIMKLKKWEALNLILWVGTDHLYWTGFVESYDPKSCP